jgi:hypothetical protein
MMHNSEETIGHVNHLDNSSITVNLCLSNDFEGGELLLSTEKCRIDSNKIYECNEIYPEINEESNINDIFNVLTELGFIFNFVYC